MSRYSEEEAQRIFARAAARQHAAAPPEGELTLDELQAIGRAAGIDPAHIAAAATETDASASPGPTWLGYPLRHRAVRRVDAPLDDAAWGRVADHFVRDASLPGTFETVGDRRLYTSASGTRVSAAPDGDGMLLTVDSARAPQDVVLYAISGIAGLMSGIGLLAFLAKGKESGLVMMAMMAVIVLVTAIGAVVGIRRRSKRQPPEIDRLTDTLAQLASPPTPASAVVDAPPVDVPPDPTAVAPPALDLDHLGDAPEADDRSADRARTR